MKRTSMVAIVLAVSVFLAAPTLTILHAQEPNSTPSGTMPITLGQSVDGSISQVGGIDRWTFQGTKNELVIITMDTKAGNLNPYMELMDPTNVKEDYDDDSGPGTNARIVTHLQKTGTYTIVAKELNPMATGTYLLRLTDPAHLASLIPSVSIDANITLAGTSDMYTFTGDVDEGVVISASSIGTFKPYVELLDPNGSIFDSTTVNSTDETQTIVKTLSLAGPYMVFVSDYWGTTGGNYTLVFCTFGAAGAAATPSPVATASPTPTPPPASTPTPTTVATATPLPATVEEALSSIAGKYTMIWNFDNNTGTWRFYNAANPGAATITKMEPWQAYWISVTQDCTLVIGSNSLQLRTGWNLVGWSK